MEEEFSFLVLLGLIIFFIWYSSRGSTQAAKSTKAAASTSLLSAVVPMVPIDTINEDPVPMDVIQAVIEKFQSTQEDMVPIETLYFKTVSEGVYSARLMFLNTRHYFGQQFDINATISPLGDVTINKTETTSDPISYVNSYKPDAYQSYAGIETSIDQQTKDALSTARGTKFQEDLTNSFNTSFKSRLSQKDLLTRASIDTEKINF
jgi:hypothetical protein